MLTKVFFLISTFVCLTYQAGIPGSVELNENTFDKIISKFDVALVKFDVAYPYGDKHDVYTALGKETKSLDNFLVAEVGVKDYGEKDNEELAKKYGASKDNFPVVKLFRKGVKEAITFDDKDGFTSTELRKFVRDNSGLYIPLAGCVEKIDKLVFEFMKADNDERKKILQKVTEVEEALEKTDAASAKIYKLMMEKVLEKGDEFVKTEYQRIKKLSSGKMSEEKKTTLNTKLNILSTFRLNNAAKEEL